MSVLSLRKDPYRLDTPAFHRDGAWLAEQIARIAVRVPIHLRGLHYALVASAKIIKPNGATYTNTDADWNWMSESAAKAARWLGHVPWEHIVDERNAAPKIFVPEILEPQVDVWCEFRYELPDARLIFPNLALSDFQPRQAYRICICGEKSSLEPVLGPIADDHGAELVLASGDVSDTLIHGIASRACEDGRPLVVLYFADFDPSGWHMSTIAARKLQAFGDLLPGMPPVQVHRVGLTLDQVKRLELPSTPLKDSERRGDRWRARMGHEQTEIDALAQLQRAELQRIAKAAIAPFFDLTLDHRARRAALEWETAARPIANAVLGARCAAARAAVEQVVAEAETKLSEVRATLCIDADELDLPPVPTVEPEHEGLAWSLVGATIRDGGLAPDDEAAPALGATAPFSEHLLRALVPLLPSQQLELVQRLVRGKDALPSRPEPLFDSTKPWREATYKLVADRKLVAEQ
jgi:hypothetical protein